MKTRPDGRGIPANRHRAMPLKLTITSYQRLSPGQEPAKTLDRGSISIGRASKNDWILQDPERILSSEHCIVHYKDGGYVLTDTSTNGTFLNDSEQRIARNQTVPLKDGDHFVLGEYEITVAITDTEIEEEEAEGPITDVALQPGLMPQPIAIPEILPPRIEASADIVKPSFSDLLTDSRDDQDHLGLDHSAAGSPHPGAVTEPPADIGGPEGAVYEPPELLIPEPPAAPQDVSPESPEPPSPAAEFASLIPDNWWEMPPAAPAQPVAPAPEPLFTPLSREPALPTPAPQPPAPVPAPVPALATAVEPAGLDTRDLLQAFLEGAGLPQLRLTDDQWLETMANLGAIFRETVRGLMDILLARGDIKGEFRLDRTAIGPVENNPLKTPPGQPPLRVEEVMALLLASQPGAYMSPVQAVHEGFKDIKAHQLAVMAGIQAALSRLLTRFDPGNLETRLQQSVLDNLWPANRKAKYWDLFNTEYQAIAREAEDDFNKLFGDEFARAYEERLRSR
jgi:type VI secretion system protein